MINTLVSEVTEEFVAGLKNKAEKYFFVPKEEETLYYKKNIRRRINDKFSAELDALPEGATFRKHGTWYIDSPRFVKKEGQRVFWANRIEVETEAYKYRLSGSLLESYTAAVTAEPQVPPHSYTGFSTTPPFHYWRESWEQRPMGFGEVGSGTTPLPKRTEELVAEGKSVFEVNWSVSVSAK